MSASFKFRKSRRLLDAELELALIRIEPANLIKRHGPSYEFEMRHHTKKLAMGSIRLRINTTRNVRYPGHIGFEVAPKFRGHRYAARSVILVLPLAVAHGLKAVWFTTDPDNIASLKTLKLIDARYVDTVRVPVHHKMYLEGERYLRRYKVDLSKWSLNTKPGFATSQFPRGPAVVTKC